MNTSARTDSAPCKGSFLNIGPGCGANPRIVRYGDRVFVRVIASRRTLMELTVMKASSMTEVIAEVRRQMAGRRGLVTMYVRNMSRGWSVERPLMLYGSEDVRARSVEPAPAPPRPRMIMPWETH